MNETLVDKFVDYLDRYKELNIHEELNPIFEDFPKDLKDVNHMIFSGPSGVGKYTQVLALINKYSKSNLKYERKAIICQNKNQYYYKLSDIHIEIDMEMLGPSAKILWLEIITQLYGIINSLNKKEFIVLCKNFDKTRDELMDIFYGYLNNKTNNIDLKFFFIVENISVIPEQILNISLILPVKRPSATNYKKIMESKKYLSKSQTVDITNIKEYLSNNVTLSYNKEILDKIMNTIINYESLDIKNLRKNIYDIFTYNLCVKTCIKDIVFDVLKVFELSNQQIKNIFLETNKFYKLFNNNYRPIYHIENLILSLIKIVHDL
jgi:DNA polymerase III delta prime subunit